MGGRQRRRWLARVLTLALLLQVLLTPSTAEALNWRLPGRGAPSPSRTPTGQGSPRFQEVPPPEGVQKLQGALEARDPKVQILSPADGTLLPDAPWTLRLQVSDWPLVDGGPLGLGPHVVVQLDGQPPRPVVGTELEMLPLSPGSHLLTVYAAKPWGEAHKGPAALQQIRLHRLAPNPATLPAPGTPQLLPVSPSGPHGAPPLLLDWLLIDAPLQGLRTETLGWRLRVTLNGESVLLDRQTPLWLRGWRQGSNALLLELLDGRGEPLNPPFNSLLQEVIVTTAPGSDRPQFAALTPLEMAVLLGDQPVSALVPASPPPSGAGLGSEKGVAEPPEPPVTGGPPALRQEASQLLPLDPAATEGTPDLVEGDRPMPSQAGPMEPEGASAAIAGPESSHGTQPNPPAPEPNPPAPEPTPEPAAAELPTETDPVPESPHSLDAPVSPSLPLSAREEVNPDGTLKRPSRPSPLERLRDRLKR